MLCTMTEPSHQVVVQFPEAAVPDFDTLARSEELLITVLGDAHVYDGVQIAAGTVNFYVLTSDRAALVLAIQAGCDWLAHPHIRVAARRLEAAPADYRPIWPQGDKRDFHLFDGPVDGTGSAWRSRRAPEDAGSASRDHPPTPPEPGSIFLPLTEGRVQGTAYQHRVQHLGKLYLPTGRLEACDPFVNLGEGMMVQVAPGAYDAYVTVADVSEEQDWSHPREAYLSVVIDDAEPSSFSFLTPPGSRPPESDEYYGVGVDAGTVAFVDTTAVSYAMPEPDTWYDDVFDSGDADSWFAVLDSEEHLIPGCANVVMPRARAGENVVMCRSGWGDGFYPVVGAYDGEGRLVSVHIDLQVDEAPGEPTP